MIEREREKEKERERERFGEGVSEKVSRVSKLTITFHLICIDRPVVGKANPIL